MTDFIEKIKTDDFKATLMSSEAVNKNAEFLIGVLTEMGYSTTVGETKNDGVTLLFTSADKKRAYSFECDKFFFSVCISKHILINGKDLSLKLQQFVRSHRCFSCELFQEEGDSSDAINFQVTINSYVGNNISYPDKQYLKVVLDTIFSELEKMCGIIIAYLLQEKIEYQTYPHTR